jgi:hypothetical protein
MATAPEWLAPVWLPGNPGFALVAGEIGRCCGRNGSLSGPVLDWPSAETWSGPSALALPTPSHHAPRLAGNAEPLRRERGKFAGAFEASELGGSLAHDMHRRASGHDSELLWEADEIDRGPVRFVPLSSSARAPALFAGSLVGNGDGGGKKILD